MKPEQFSAFIPFSGFYYSIHDQLIDDAEEGFFVDTNGDVSNHFLGLLQTFRDHVDFGAVRKAYAKEYVELLKEEIGLASIQFEELTSPREYNFQTDKIYVRISRSDLAKMLSAVRGEKLNKKIKELFSSRSGFISFYPDHISGWPPISEWDHNHVGAVFSAYVELNHTGIEDAIVEKMSCNSSISECLYSAADFTGKAAADLAYAKRILQDEGLYPVK